VRTGYRGEQHVELAGWVEFIHTATCCTDDVVDESDLRRRPQDRQRRVRNAASVLVGDFLYSRLPDHGRRGQHARDGGLGRRHACIAEGEVLQLLNAHNCDIGEAAYLEVIRRKTAKLFEAAAQLGAIPGRSESGSRGRNGALRPAPGHRAFQLIDDVLDYSGDAGHTGKNLGDDLKEGKPTASADHVIQRGSPAQRPWCARRSEHGGGEGIQPVLDAIHETGGSIS